MADIVTRVKNIIMTPKTEWPVIDAEPGETREVFQYVAILAAIPAIATIIGGMLLPGASFSAILTLAIVGYVLAFAVVYLVALIIDALAPTFSSEKHFPSALKLAAYSYTPAWVGGIFGIIPVLGILALIASLYGLYLLYLGIPVLMRTPPEKVVGYTLVIIVCAIVASIIISIIIASIVGLGVIGAGIR